VTPTYPPLVNWVPPNTIIQIHSHLDIKHKDGSFSNWTPSQLDLFAEDWVFFDYDDVILSTTTTTRSS
jgi:hypothetical protein